MEAVQFREWGPWHAVRSADDERTACGRPVLKAIHMWEHWSEQRHERCKMCDKAAD